MLYEMARLENDEERTEQFRQAKRDYDNAVNRFNNADAKEMTELAVFDMNTAMKRLCVIVKQEQAQ